MSNETLEDLPVLYWRRFVVSKASAVCWWIWIEVIYAYNLVVCSTSQPLPVRTKSDSVNSSAMVAQVAELFRLVVFSVAGIAHSFHAPNANLAITGGGCESGGIWRYMARVYFEVLLLSWEMRVSMGPQLERSWAQLRQADLPL